MNTTQTSAKALSIYTGPTAGQQAPQQLYDLIATNTGDAMYPEIKHGDILACNEIRDTSFIDYGAIYWVILKNGLSACRVINGNRVNENELLLTPCNGKAGVTPIPRSAIEKLYVVKRLLRGY